MEKTGFQSVDQYIAAQPDDVRAALERVRTIVRRALPGAEEVISYRIPAYRLHGRIVLYFAGWREHYSIYPVGRVAAELRDAVAPYQAGKGTLKFPLTEPVPARLIARIAKVRARETAERAKKR